MYLKQSRLFVIYALDAQHTADVKTKQKQEVSIYCPAFLQACEVEHGHGFTSLTPLDSRPRRGLGQFQPRRT